MLAATHGKCAPLSFLVEVAKELELEDAILEKVLLAAARTGHLNCIQYLLELNDFRRKTLVVQEALEYFTFERVNEVIYLRDALIEHVIGQVIIRSDAARDPYRGISDSRAALNKVREVWNALPSAERTHDLAHLAMGGSIGVGGLAVLHHRQE